MSVSLIGRRPASSSIPSPPSLHYRLPTSCPDYRTRTHRPPEPILPPDRQIADTLSSDNITAQNLCLWFPSKIDCGTQKRDRVYDRCVCCREAVGQFIGKVWSRLARNNLQGGVPSVWRVVSCWASTTWEEPAAWILQDQSQPILRTSLHNTRIWWSQLSLLHQKAWKYFTQNLLRVLSSSRPYQALTRQVNKQN